MEKKKNTERIRYEGKCHPLGWIYFGNRKH
jgi:hypothetical protein